MKNRLRYFVLTIPILGILYYCYLHFKQGRDSEPFNSIMAPSIESSPSETLTPSKEPVPNNSAELRQGAVDLLLADNPSKIEFDNTVNALCLSGLSANERTRIEASITTTTRNPYYINRALMVLHKDSPVKTTEFLLSSFEKSTVNLDTIAFGLYHQAGFHSKEAEASSSEIVGRIVALVRQHTAHSNLACAKWACDTVAIFGTDTDRSFLLKKLKNEQESDRKSALISSLSKCRYDGVLEEIIHIISEKKYENDTKIVCESMAALVRLLGKNAQPYLERLAGSGSREIRVDAQRYIAVMKSGG